MKTEFSVSLKVQIMFAGEKVKKLLDIREKC